MKNLIICFIVAMVSILQGCGDRKTTISEDFEKDESVYESETLETTVKELIYVYVCGQVKKPGVYALDSGSRVCDGIELAGGVLKDASLDNLNLAALLEDGEKLYVYSKAEASTAILENVQTDNKLVNINTASIDELMDLPGIGKTRAEAIINYRDNNGLFESIEDIMKINGIKQSVFDKIKESISVR
ncbi:MAG: helix-hairpin-helix domain-containing protein [Lachnospiraceae bacterium]|nr:helix-hairpin-helix domain-containing protein [Lachnospiraceae bacterium]